MAKLLQLNQALTKTQPSSVVSEFSTNTNKNKSSQKQVRKKVEYLLSQASKLLKESEESDALLSWMVEDCLELLLAQNEYDTLPSKLEKNDIKNPQDKSLAVEDARLKLKKQSELVTEFIRK
jgi:hypothetical protein